MNFVSFVFLAFLLVILTLRFTIGRSKTETSYLLALLLGSLVFYAWHVPWYVFILLFSAIVDYVAGKKLASGTRTAREAKFLVTASVTVNLGLLAFFKYTNFGIDAFTQFFRAIGLATAPSWHLDLILPIGISFYTFQSMSYTIDIYRGELKPARSFWRFLLYVSFFPQLVAGPIVRARDFLYQIPRVRRPHASVFLQGFYLIIRGYFLKLVVADNLGAFVDRNWGSAAGAGGDILASVTLTLMFSCQIFCDFAGYSSIARGLALLLGFRLPVNFQSPYIAASFSEFWRRWHITLSSWLRRYLYFSLGGNKNSTRRTYFNLTAVMVLGGLWHGAAANFLAWGALHGVGLAIERALGLNDSNSRRLPVVRIGWFVVVQLFVLLAWIMFRATRPEEVVGLLRNLGQWNIHEQNWIILKEGFLYFLPVVAIHSRRFLFERFGVHEPGPVEKALLAGAMLYFVLVGYGVTSAFIYFQF